MALLLYKRLWGVASALRFSFSGENEYISLNEIWITYIYLMYTSTILHNKMFINKCTLYMHVYVLCDVTCQVISFPLGISDRKGVYEAMYKTAKQGIP